MSNKRHTLNFVLLLTFAIAALVLVVGCAGKTDSEETASRTISIHQAA